MLFSELPIELQEQLNQERPTLKNKNTNTPYEIHIYNEDGTRYFFARRFSESWSDPNTGNYMPFGGGSHWRMSYGKTQFERFRNPVGEMDVRWADGKTYGKSANGTVIPREVGTKKEVMAIIKAIGIFNL